MIIPRHFSGRKEIYEAGLHNSYQKGIGRARDGSNLMSIVLSGGYIDDEDFGNEIVYTGEGGRDPKSGNQIKNQSLDGGNLDLLKAFELSQPVYVIRGSGHKSNYSPKEGYDFCGKFLIQEHWIEKGQDGFDIVRFKLVSDIDPFSTQSTTDNNENKKTSRVEYTSTRIIRDTKVSKQVKDLYEYSCQVCGQKIQLPSGDFYAEGAHIMPLGIPHNGPDTIQNILCLCPNHHIMFDRYTFSINPQNLNLEGTLSGRLKLSVHHNINKDYLQYHWENYIKHK